MPIVSSAIRNTVGRRYWQSTTCLRSGSFPFCWLPEVGFRRLQRIDCRGFLAPFGLQPQQYILSVGTLEPRKNLTTAIKAYARLPEVIRAEIPLVIAGMKGWRTDGLDKEVAALIDKGQIRRLGYVPDEALPALYSGARAFVYPSLYEGFGLPPLEAMACGAPVIVSNRSSLPEVVEDAGLQVDALDVQRVGRGDEPGRRR